MPFVPLLTQAGAAAIVNYAAGSIGQVEITQIGLTDIAFTMASTLTALPGEFKRLPLFGDTLGDNVIHIEARDTSADVYSYSGFGLYTSAGVLFAVYGQADPIVGKVAASSSWIVLDIGVTQDQAAAITFGDTNFLNPPASTDGQGVVELATLEETKAGADALRAVTPATLKAALLTLLTAQDGAGSDVDADLLDGQQGAWYADIVSRLGYVPLDSVAFTGAAIRTLLGFTPLDAAAFTRAAVEAFMDDPARAGSNAHGYWERRPNGVLEQWGYVDVPSGSNVASGTLTFPQPFDFTDPDSVVVVGNICNPPSGVWSAATFICEPSDANTSAWHADTTNQDKSFDAGIRASWRAIGKAAA